MQLLAGSSLTFTTPHNEPTNNRDMRPAPAHPSAQTTLDEGLDHLRARRLPEAIDTLRQALLEEPGRIAAVRGLATAQLLAGEVVAARQTLATFITQHPLADEGWRLAARLEWKLGQRPAALDLLRRGLTKLPGSRVLRQELGLFTAAMNGGVAPTAPAPEATTDANWLDRLVNDPKALDALLASPSPTAQREMLTQLESRLANELAGHPRHADRQFLLARLRHRLGDPNGAMAAVDAALALNPKLTAAHHLKAKLFTEGGWPREALGVLRRLVASGITWPDVLAELAALEQQVAALDAPPQQRRAA
jgi:predicted Zn-dependent protease